MDQAGCCVGRIRLDAASMKEPRLSRRKDDCRMACRAADSAEFTVLIRALQKDIARGAE